jgi:transcriptional regulator with GAF, ATPase, and Fis domain
MVLPPARRVAAAALAPGLVPLSVCSNTTPELSPMNADICPVITNDPAMKAILNRVETIARFDCSVLLIGETGVGKELFADFVHHASTRAGKSFIKVEAAALPHELLESELFGYERGAFTSAFSSKKGLFEMASAGTLFLDDIDDFPIELQAKLLRTIEAREILRLGGTSPIRVDIRLIAATKVDLVDLVRRGLFRSDLYYRLNEIPVHIPPLRQRREDIPLLAAAFLKRFAPDRELVVGEDAQRALMAHSWPGNVRELRNVMRRVAIFAEGGKVRERDLPQEITCQTTIRHDLTPNWMQCLMNEHPSSEEVESAYAEYLANAQLSFDEVVGCVERNLLRFALRQAGGNQVRAARSLRMNPSTFRDRLKKYRLTPYAQSWKSTLVPVASASQDSPA